MRNFRRPALALGAAATMVLGAAPVQAHAFGPRYDLPLPLDLYLVGAGCAVGLSFVIMALVLHGRPADTDLLRVGPMQVLFHPAVTAVVRSVSVGLFVLVLAAGLFGAQDTLD
ncbi:MAG TPA: hypothetical protein VGA77_11030, partial [Propylenella sp.]